MWGKIEEFLFIKLTLYLSYLNKANYIIFKKLSRVFSVVGFHFEEKWSHQLQYF